MPPVRTVEDEEEFTNLLRELLVRSQSSAYPLARGLAEVCNDTLVPVPNLALTPSLAGWYSL